MPASPDDPFAAIEQMARQKAAEESATRAITIARTKLVLGRDAKSVFFATLALRLKPVIAWEEETMAVDGKSLFYNPDFTNGLQPEEVMGVVVHEVMHCSLNHHARRMGRDPYRWNVAADLAINHLLVQNGFVLPKKVLMPGQGSFTNFAPGLSAEEYYTQLPQDMGQGEPGTDPGGCGRVRDPRGASPADCANEEADWQAATAQAESAANSRGTMPAGLSRMCDQVLRPAADWKAVLREFVSRSAKSDFSWARPNRRFIAQGLYLPGLYSEELGEVLVLVDTSGSIGQEELSVFGNELDGILSSFDCTATVVYHDSEPCKVDEWASTDGPFKLEPVGGGGTSHEWLGEWLEKHGSTPACIVCLTDMATDFGADPGIPVLWAKVGNYGSDPPFGRVVNINA
jgi:predicted metal-dependent peptidase